MFEEFREEEVKGFYDAAEKQLSIPHQKELLNHLKAAEKHLESESKIESRSVGVKKGDWIYQIYLNGVPFSFHYYLECLIMSFQNVE